MKKQLHLLVLLGIVGITQISAQTFENRLNLFPTTYTNNSGIKFVQDSVYNYGKKENSVKSYEFRTYNNKGYESEAMTVSVSWDGTKKNSEKILRFYDDKNALIEKKELRWKDNDWYDYQTENYLYSFDKLDRLYGSKYDADLDEWFNAYTEVSNYNNSDALQSYTRYTKFGVFDELTGDIRFTYSAHNNFNKPTEGRSYRYENGKWQDYMTISFEYDSIGHLVKFIYKKIEEDGTEKNTTAKEYIYNEFNQLQEEISLRADYKTGELSPTNKTEYTYDADHNYLTESKSYRFSRQKWSLTGRSVYFWSEFKASEPDEKAKPLARIGSHWNYWVAQERSYGFNQYKIVKDTILTAPVYETGELLTANTSWIEKYSNLTFQGAESGTEHEYEGEFGAIRIGNASYIYEPRHKKWFKWIDMDAELGAKWIVPEIISGKGVCDYVEVSFRDTIEIDGRNIPYIYLMPSCTSRFTTKKDFTSRISMSGYFNIDYWSLQGSPEPIANGMAYMQQLREVNSGLLCADVNGESLVTEKLAEYVQSNNKPLFDQGIIECDSLHAPMNPQKPAYIKPVLEENKPVYNLFTTPVDLQEYEANVPETAARQSEAAADDSTKICIPTVVHVVYNPETPEEKITEEQIKTMLVDINEAFSTEKTEQVRDVYKEVIGNPHINFVLAEKDTLGNATNGILYYETDEKYFSLTGRDVKQKYAYRFNQDGSARNWDNKKYANIYIVDLGGFDQLKNIGGFVTNPEAHDEETWQQQKDWYATSNLTFWQNWINSEEGAQLDGLTLDAWYTFGGASALNPAATTKTAIHELGHYAGLRHVSVQVVENADGSIELFDDGFTDTPSTHYNQYMMIPCEQDLFQCGELVQVENYMDYCLECACMFTKQQASFMRHFVQSVRPTFVPSSLEETYANDHSILVYPNPASDIVNFKGTFTHAKLLNSMGQIIYDIEGSCQQISINNLTTGIYFIRFYL